MKKKNVPIYCNLKADKIISFILFLAVLPAVAFGQFSGENAFQFLEMQTNMGPRNPGSAAHEKCLDFLQDQLQNSGAKVELQSFMHYDRTLQKSLTMTNIIGSFYPEKTSRIMLCAHWDTRPFADRDILQNRNKPIIGANDGASGVAVLLEIALQLQKSPPPGGIDILLFDGEDYGREGDLDNYCLGSRYFAANNTRFYPQFAILLDMIGDTQLRIPMEGYSRQYAPEVVNRLWNLAEVLGHYQFDLAEGPFVFDDHLILNQAGIPAIDIIDFEYPDADNGYWHTLRDIPENCSPESLQVVGEVLMKLIYEQQP
jgi:glutaminyl-peptide cyclotransferase